MIFVVRLQISRRRYCYCYCSKRLGLFMQPHSVHTSKSTKRVFFVFHKVSCDIYFDGLFRDIGLYINHTHDGNEKQGEPERDRSRMQQTFDGK